MEVGVELQVEAVEVLLVVLEDNTSNTFVFHMMCYQLLSNPQEKPLPHHKQCFFLLTLHIYVSKEDIELLVEVLVESVS